MLLRHVTKLLFFNETLQNTPANHGDCMDKSGFILGAMRGAAKAAVMQKEFHPQPILLEGKHVRLEPLSLTHAPGLFTASQDETIWRWLPAPMFPSVAAVEAWIADALKEQSTGAVVPFATVRISDGKAVGSTRFIDIRRPHRALEIGWTWIATEAQRTVVNTEAKLLMLRHAFEDQGAIRVQLKTDEKMKNPGARSDDWERCLRAFCAIIKPGFTTGT